MSKLFLNKRAINLEDFSAFKEGVMDLMEIKKVPTHTFYKHDSIYEIPILITLYSTYGYEEQEISRFIEQEFSSCRMCIDTEEKANEYCNSDYNAFLGIDFTAMDINPIKCIINDNSYYKWNYSFLSTFELFLEDLGECVYGN